MNDSGQKLINPTLKRKRIPIPLEVEETLDGIDETPLLNKGMRDPLSMFKTHPLADINEIIDWIVLHLDFIKASLTGELDNWVFSKKHDLGFKVNEWLLEDFSNNLKKKLENPEAIDPLHKATRSIFPNPFLSFQTSISLLRKVEGLDRNDQLLKIFLNNNSSTIAEFLGYELPKLEFIAKLWEKDQQKESLLARSMGGFLQSTNDHFEEVPEDRKKLKRLRDESEEDQRDIKEIETLPKKLKTKI
jgi:hypothetical protein